MKVNFGQNYFHSLVNFTEEDFTPDFERELVCEETAVNCLIMGSRRAEEISELRRDVMLLEVEKLLFETEKLKEERDKIRLEKEYLEMEHRLLLLEKEKLEKQCNISPSEENSGDGANVP